MTALTLFVASFVVVFALGFQQLNVTANYVGVAFVTSLAISGAMLVQFKYLPGPTTAVEIWCYLVGSGLGIVAAMRAHPAIVDWCKRRSIPITVTYGSPTTGTERADLESDIALDAAVDAIESFCAPFTMGMLQWFDTDNPTSAPSTGPLIRRDVDRATRYLELREHIVRHPTVHSLVRFKV
jgi:hypothetical protein